MLDDDDDDDFPAPGAFGRAAGKKNLFANKEVIDLLSDSDEEPVVKKANKSV